MAELLIGGAPVITLHAQPPLRRPGIVEATVLPGRGFMLLQAVAVGRSGERLTLLHAPCAVDAARELAGGADDFAGNRSFAFGGALLAPYANRIRGRALPDTRQIEAKVDGRTVRLPRNWGGRTPGAEQYAMHGLILAAQATVECLEEDAVQGRMTGFGEIWPGKLELTLAWRLRDGGLSLRLDAQNTGSEPTPFGAGWHPYFNLPSGNRREARLTLPASLRSEVNDYDEVLPTGRLLQVAGTPYDFRTGRALGDLYLDDCFSGLSPGPVEINLSDPDASFGLRITTASPPVRAVQVYAPPDEPFVVVEPQFNLADPFGPQWAQDADTGMVRLAPGEAASYEVRVDLSAP